MFCPGCKKEMQHISEDGSYKCPDCKGTYWHNEPTMACPRCGREMKHNITFGFFKCSHCGSEFWPPEKDEISDEEQKEDDPSTWKCHGMVKAMGATINGKGGSKAGKKHKKRKPMPQVLSQRYLLY